MSALAAIPATKAAGDLAPGDLLLVDGIWFRLDSVIGDKRRVVVEGETRYSHDTLRTVLRADREVTFQ